MSFSGSIIIVNFNSGEYLARCLQSIEEHAPSANVIVIDNASTDGSAGSAALRRDGVTLWVNPRNVGFARAVNQGLAAARPMVMLLNPDCYLLPGAADRLEEELESYTQCAIVGPKILNDDGSVQGSARGDPTLFTGFFGRTTLLARLFPNSRLARHNVRTDTERVTSGESFAVDWVSGACMMARRETLTAVGGFDERYFMYWEDADLCRRLRNNGRSTRYVPSSAIVHTVGVSSRGARTLTTTAFHQSAYTYYATHVARTVAGRALAWTLLKLRCRLKLLGGADDSNAPDSSA